MSSSTTKTFVFDGYQLDYKTSGQGEPLVLIHADHNFAKRLLQSKLCRYQIITLDTPGFYSGKQEKPVESMEKLNQLFEKLFAKLKFKKVNLVGQCLGAIIATRFTASYPQRVKKLIIISLPLVYFRKEFIFTIRKSFLLVKNNPSLQSLIAFAIKSRMAQKFGHVLGGYKNFIEALTKESNQTSVGFDQQVFFNILGDAFDTNLAEKFGAINCPTLFLAGKKDPLGDNKSLKKLAALAKSAEINLISKASHAVVQRNFNEVRKPVLSFLAEPKS